MALGGTRVRFKASDIWDAPEDGKIYEVIDGELHVTPAPDWGHQVFVTNLAAVLATFVKRHRLGHVVVAPTGVVLGEETGVEPDVIFISSARSDIISRRGVEGAPDLVVEVLSPSTAARDRGIKMRAYAAAGVPHYWMANPVTRSVEVHRLGEHGYELVAVFSTGDILRSDLFAGLEIPLDDLWD